MCPPTAHRCTFAEQSEGSQFGRGRPPTGSIRAPVPLLPELYTSASEGIGSSRFSSNGTRSNCGNAPSASQIRAS
jgi:hypothetical protein